MPVCERMSMNIDQKADESAFRCVANLRLAYQQFAVQAFCSIIQL